MPAPFDRLDARGKNEDEKSDERRCRTVDAERADEKYLNGSEVERGKHADERNRLKHAAQKPIKKDQLESGENEYDAVEEDSEFRERDAEDTRILARGDDVASRKIPDIADERRARELVLGEIGRIRKPAEREEEDENDARPFHIP